MKEQYARRLRILYILKYFKEYSDENHSINTTEILEYLKTQDITATRKTIYEDINALCEFGIDIYKSPVTKEGYYLDYRDIDVAQLRTLCDAVASAPFISNQKSVALIEQITALTSSFEKEKIHNYLSINNRVKSNNEQIYFVIDVINKAINNNRKITFEYNKYMIIDNKPVLTKYKDFKLSPYALVWCNDNYYLVGNYEKYDNLSNYRIDRIRNAVALKETSRHFSDVCEYVEKFDVADYIKKNIMMFTGEETEIELLCKNTMIDIIVDKFGTECEIINKAKGRFLVRVSVYLSDGLVNWLLPLCKDVYVEQPKVLRDMLIERTKKISDSFTNSSLKL